VIFSFANKSMDETFKECRLLGILAVGKTVYILLIVIVLRIFPDPDFIQSAAIYKHWPREGGFVFSSHFATWDTAHYLYLSEIGYAKTRSSCAFFPLWPILVRYFSVITSSNHLISGLLLSNIFSLVAWFMFHSNVAKQLGESVANWSLVFLALFPGSLFYQFHYTESLFFLLIMVLWWGLEEKRYGWAWIGALCLPLTRGVGVFAVLPIAAHALKHTINWRNQQVFNRNSTDRHQIITFPIRPVLLLTAPLIGWAGYLILIWHWTGNPFEGFEAQNYWGVHSISNLWNFPKFILGFFTPTQWHEFSGSALDRCTFFLIFDCLIIIWRFDKKLLIWTYILGILPAMSGTFTSFTRFASCVFPMFIALGVIFGKPERSVARWSLLLVFGLLHIVLLWRFVNFRWAG